MKIILFSFLLLCTIQAKTQHYFNYINKAEQLIIDKNYSKALENYQTVFSKHHYGRWNDYYNATLCAIKLNQNKQALPYFYSCLTAGMTLKDFKNTEIESKLINTQANSCFFEKCDSLTAIGANKKNTKLYNEFLLKMDYDQSAFRNEELLNDTYKWTKFFYDNGVNLARQIIKDSLPDMGLFNAKSNQVFWLIVRHYFGNMNTAKAHLNRNDAHYNDYLSMINDSLLYKTLQNLIKKGKCSPSVLRDGLIHGQSKKIFGNACIYKYFIKEDNAKSYQTKPDLNFWFTEDVSDKKQLALYNENRAKIGLPDFYQEQRIANQFTKENNYTTEFKFSYSNRNEMLIHLPNSTIKLVKKRKGIQTHFSDIDKINFINQEFVKNENIVKFSY